MNIKKDISELVGKTPMMLLSKIMKEYSLEANIFAKLECFNPAGSVKDRVALSMINDFESKGVLKEGSVIIEPTSGNTGIGLAAISASRGYRTILTMPNTMSVERIALLKAFGAEVVLTDGKDGMNGAIAKANELSSKIPNSIIAGQFDNPANPTAHITSTGPEIWEDVDGDIDIFVAGVGTGGTLTGVAKYLKDKKEGIKIIAVEPDDSPYLSKNKSGPHKLQGIGAGFLPKVLDTSLIDEILTVSTDEAYEFGNAMAKKEGILVGISSGAALSAAVRIANRDENKGKNIVVLLSDSGERYLSTDMFM